MSSFLTCAPPSALLLHSLCCVMDLCLLDRRMKKLNKRRKTLSEQVDWWMWSQGHRSAHLLHRKTASSMNSRKTARIVPVTIDFHAPGSINWFSWWHDVWVRAKINAQLQNQNEIMRFFKCFSTYLLPFFCSSICKNSETVHVVYE